MIYFEKFKLPNGLTVIHHLDKSTPLVCVNILYNVGARDEDENRTGFAHLFEHLMFGGSINIPNYDEPLQKVGGENNAFTTNDITNYYLTLPAVNIETAFWLESDRMLSLAFSEKSLDVQRNVVIEEFKQRYLNQPYGDVWLLLRPLAYKVHPYKWDTIGKEISHISEAKMDDVKGFFKKFYCPNNAILVVAGNASLEQVKELSEKWFGPIPKGPDNNRNLPKEPEQTEARKLEVIRDVPYDNIYKAYHMCARGDEAFHACDLLSDILSRGNSARLYNALVKNKPVFSELNAYVSGDNHEGLFIISGKLLKGVKLEDAEKEVLLELDKIRSELVSETELKKVKNKTESTLEFSEMSILNKALNLAVSELMGDAAMVNDEGKKYQRVTAEQIREQANRIFRESNCSTLYYHSKN
ncbi:MAG TPA: pitrilysin family protein [Bacteroidia bacterium]